MRVRKPLSSSPDDGPRSEARRAFLRSGTAAVGAALLPGPAGVSAARAEALDVPEWTRSMGAEIPDTGYGLPVRFERHVVRRRSGVLVNRQRWSDWSMTPLQHQHGIVTPNGLIFQRNHAGVPEIDPEQHRLVIHGMVRQPLVFTMSDLMRYPSVSKFHFLECSGNTLTDWTKAASPDVQMSHGLLSGAQWTGVPVAWLLEESGIQPDARWVLFEGADGASHARSIPLENALADCLIVYAQNGEKLRAEQGYPIRLLIPGWEGNTNVKWLRRIKLGAEPWQLRSETARYTDPMPDGKWRQFSMVMECKSVITDPSGGMQLAGAGWYEIKGFAWSGRGSIATVDVTTDGGRTWRQAVLEPPVLDKMLTRFRFRWRWDGEPARIASRAIDATGYVQPTVQEIARARELTGFVQHHNGVFPWAIESNGEVRNAIAIG